MGRPAEIDSLSAEARRWIGSRMGAAATAKAGGYFWLPCPCCGDYFGGHEWRDRDGLPSSVPLSPETPGQSKGICPTCTEDGYGYPAFFFAPEVTAWLSVSQRAAHD